MAAHRGDPRDRHLVLIPGMSANPIVVLIASLVLPVSSQPPMIVAFLGGMLAPRAAWLVGGVVSILAAPHVRRSSCS